MFTLLWKPRQREPCDTKNFLEGWHRPLGPPPTSLLLGHKDVHLAWATRSAGFVHLETTFFLPRWGREAGAGRERAGLRSLWLRTRHRRGPGGPWLPWEHRLPLSLESSRFSWWECSSRNETRGVLLTKEHFCRKQLLPPVVGERGAGTREEEGRGGLAPPGMLLHVCLRLRTWLTWLVLWFEAWGSANRTTGQQPESEIPEYVDRGAWVCFADSEGYSSD